MSQERIDRAERYIAAPVDIVYGAFVDPISILKWLPPSGSSAELIAFEPRPGGRFELRLSFDAPGTGKLEDNSDVVRGSFELLSPNEAILQHFQFESDDPKFAGTMAMRWSFAPDRSGTLVTVEVSDVPEGIAPEDHQKDLRSSLENLARLLEKR